MQPATTYSAVLGNVVAHHRKGRGLTQADMAKRLAMTQAGYSGLERGRSPFTVPQLKRVGGVLGLTAAQLLQETDEAASRLRQQGVEVLGEKPSAGESNKWLWIAGGVILAAVAAVIAVEAVKKESG